MEELRILSIAEISPNPYQPRTQFDSQKLEELAQSIRENGIIQPVIVRPSALVGYELLAGERRFRASQLAGLTEIPAIIKELSDKDMSYQAIIENLQRADLNPIEEATSYQRLVQKGFTQEEIAKRIGKSRPYISNSIRLLQLAPSLLQAVESGEVSQGHARLLLSLSKKEQEGWLDKLRQHPLTVRQLEDALSKKKSHKKQENKNLFLREQEEVLRKELGFPVRIKQNKQGAGSIQIDFQNLEEFEQIIHNFK